MIKIIYLKEESNIRERILLNVDSYYIGYDGTGINVYEKGEKEYNLLFSPNTIANYQIEPYITITGMIQGTNVYSKCDKAFDKAINWLKHTGRNRHIEIVPEMKDAFISLSIYHWIKTDNYLNMEVVDNANEYFSTIYKNFSTKYNVTVVKSENNKGEK